MKQTSKTLRQLSRFTIVLAFIVIILGAYTRLVHAGLGCPDWPGCYGFLLVPETPADIIVAEQRYPNSPVDLQKAWPEVIHRILAGSLGLTIATMFIMSFINTAKQRSYEAPDKTIYSLKLLSIMLITVVFQAVLGMWTVTLKLWPQVVVAHLLGGFTTLSLAWLLLLDTHNSFQKSTALETKTLQRLKVWGVIVFSAIVIQIALGAWVSANYAAIACTEFPMCQSRWIPSMDLASGFNIQQNIGPNYLGGRLDNDARIAIHFVHRLGALVVTLLSLVYAFQLWRSKQAQLRSLSLILVLILVIQISLGISNVIFGLPLYIAVAHNAVGASLLLAAVSIIYCLHKTKAVSVNDYTASTQMNQLA